MGMTKINQDDLAQLNELFKDGKIAPVIDRCFPLGETVEAIRYVINTHARGKIIIKVVQDHESPSPRNF